MIRFVPGAKEMLLAESCAWGSIEDIQFDGTGSSDPDGTIVQPSADGTIYGLDPATGEKRWAFDTLEAVRSSPAIDAEGNIYVGSGEGRLFVLNADGTFSYTHDGDASGVDSFTYQVSDGRGGLDIATVAVTVSTVNNAPVAVNDTYLTIMDTPLTVDAPGVLDNDSDSDGDPLIALMDSPVASGTLVYGPAIHGTLLLGSDGGFVYTPTLGFSGVVTFTYNAHDGTTSSNIATVEITVSAQVMFLPITMRNHQS